MFAIILQIFIPNLTTNLNFIRSESTFPSLKIRAEQHSRSKESSSGESILRLQMTASQVEPSKTSTRENEDGKEASGKGNVCFDVGQIPAKCSPAVFAEMNRAAPVKREQKQAVNPRFLTPSLDTFNPTLIRETSRCLPESDRIESRAFSQRFLAAAASLENR